MKPKQSQKKKKKNQIKPTRKTHSLCGFRFSRKRELERLKRKIRVKRNKPEVAKRDGRRARELQLGRETQREASRERNRAQCVRDFKFHRVCGYSKSMDLSLSNTNWI